MIPIHIPPLFARTPNVLLVNGVEFRYLQSPLNMHAQIYLGAVSHTNRLSFRNLEPVSEGTGKMHQNFPFYLLTR